MLSVSAILTTHNRPKGLHRALRSVQRQTRRPDEVVVVDDGSRSIVQSRALSREFPQLNIAVLRNESSCGPAKARNQGAYHSKGNVLMFLDDDDTWEPSKVEQQLSVFEKKGREIGLIYSGRLVVSHQDRSRILYRVKGNCEGNIFPEILRFNCIGVTSSVAIRRTVFEEAGGFDIDQPAREDYEMWIRCSKLTKVAPDHTYGLRYTYTSASGVQISRSPVSQHVRAVKRIIKKHWDDIQALSTVEIRKVYAEKWYYVAKMARRNGLGEAWIWIIRSMASYPMLKTMLLVLSPGVRSQLRGIIQYVQNYASQYRRE